VADRRDADIDLFVRVPGTSDAGEDAFVTAIDRDVPHILGGPSSMRWPTIAIADLSFLAANDYPAQRRLTQDLIAKHIAGSVGSFASWNTVANTVGTALPEAIAVIAGRRLGTYDESAHATFTLMRYVDDVVFHTEVRPKLNGDLDVQGIDDHTFLPPDVADRVAHENRALLWPAGLDLLAQIAPQFRDAGFTITLPWDRTFETELDVRLAPRLQGSRIPISP